jgi:hypothetical protein
MRLGSSTTRGETATLRGIVTVVLPAYPDLAAERGAVEDDVTRYLASQIGAMPSFLRLPYRLALRGFALLPLLRYGRSFHALPSPRRKAYLALWSDAPLTRMRELVKLIRTTALLVYFDHPAVRERLDAERRHLDPREPSSASNPR